ncbi:AraC family transcriptional regulator [Ekhidna sp.]|uniref:AraC family transcriptional regulator n=1 Tax=Ekhidna sp. TaxID=2608089 RepID=UPI0032969659
MNFHLHIPEGQLALHIQSIAYFDAYSPDYEKERLLPDGCQTLIIDLTETPKRIFDNIHLTDKQVCKRYWFSGARNELLTIDAGGINSSMLVINFTFTGAYQFIHHPSEQTKSQVIDASVFFQSQIHSLREQLLNTEEVQTKFSITEHFLKRHLLDQSPPEAIIRASNLIASNPQAGTLKWLSENSGYSQKHFIGLFKKYLGLTPKGFQKIMRFQKVVKDLESVKTINWTQLALDCGYYDQAHFINEFKTFSGFNPQLYLSEKGPDLNYIPLR